MLRLIRLATVGAVWLVCCAQAAPDQAIRDARDARARFSQSFTHEITAPPDAASLEPAIAAVSALARTGGDTPLGAEAQLEWSELLRVLWRNDEAIPLYREAVRRAVAANRPDLAFEAQIGLARAYGTVRKHGEALWAALEAEALASASKDPNQLSRLAQFSAELAVGRGETLASLAYAAEQLVHARDPYNQAWAWASIGFAFDKIATTHSSRFDIPAAEKALRASRAAYGKSVDLAGAAGMPGYRSLMNGAVGRADHKLAMLAELAAGHGQMEARTRHLFRLPDLTEAPTWRLDDPRFASAEGYVIGEERARAAVADDTLRTIVPEAVRQEIDRSVNSLALKGMAAAGRGDVDGATRLWQEAVAQLDRERGSYFDIEHRGSLIEVNAGTHELLAFALMRANQYPEGFAVFESIRARGLADLAASDRPELADPAHRAFLGSLLKRDASVALAERDLAASMVNSPGAPPDGARLGRVTAARQERNRLLRSQKERIDRLATASAPPLATLAETEAAVRATGVPVLLYWTDSSSVTGWMIAPGGSRVLNIAFPVFFRAEKIRALRESAETPSANYDDRVAREMHILLIGPFADLLGDARELIVVPQAELHRVPFEMLVDPATGKPLIDRVAISYAHNATLAVRALRQAWETPKRTTAVYDAQIDAGTGEAQAIAAALGAKRVQAVATHGLTQAKLDRAVVDADVVHFLVHGAFNAREPMLSTLNFRNADIAEAGGAVVTAAELTRLPLGKADLAVLSACESGNVEVRLSNEIFGIPWAVLAAGADRALVSRWRVKAVKQGEWMGHFYSALAKGDRPALASAAAMRAMRAEAATAHPFWWAAPQMIGR